MLDVTRSYAKDASHSIKVLQTLCKKISPCRERSFGFGQHFVPMLRAFTLGVGTSYARDKGTAVVQYSSS